MWDNPALIHGIAMKAAGKLVVYSASGHFFERSREHLLELVCVGTGVRARPAERNSASCVLVDQQIDSRRMWKFRRAAESAMLLVEHLQGRLHNLIHDLWR